MARIVLPVIWTTQPKYPVGINYGNPLANGLIHLWGSNVSGSSLIKDSANKANGVFGTGNSWNHGSVGNDYVGFGGTSASLIPIGDSSGSASPNSNVFSLFARLSVGSIGLVNAPIYSSDGNNGVQWRIAQSSHKLELLKTGVWSIGSGTTAFNASVVYDLGVTYDGTVATFYVNGVQDGTASSASQTFTHSQQYNLGGDTVSTEYVPSGSRLYIAGVYSNVILPASAFVSLANNPWQLFQPSPRKIWMPSAGGGGFNPAWGFGASQIIGGGYSA